MNNLGIYCILYVYEIDVKIEYCILNQNNFCTQYTPMDTTEPAMHFVEQRLYIFPKSKHLHIPISEIQKYTGTKEEAEKAYWNYENMRNESLVLQNEVISKINKINKMKREIKLLRIAALFHKQAQIITPPK